MKEQNRSMLRAAKTVAVTATVLLLAACGTLSQGISQDGAQAQQLVWPAPQDTNGLHSQGTYPTPQAIASIHPGMNKSQLQALIGPPHFGEAYGTREWDYLFHLRQPGQNGFVVCQLKLLYGEDGTVGSQHWRPASCAPQEPAAPVAAAPAAAPAPAPLPALINVPAAPAEPERRTLRASALFRFNGSSVADILPEGQRELQALSALLLDPQRRLASVRVLAHTDRLGTAAYNQALSQQRAASVAEYLRQRGVDPARIAAVGLGAGDPVSVGCEKKAKASRQALIDCLAPDRRVVFEIRWQPAAA